MSRRYSKTVVCPGCGLEVMAGARGIRPHSERALEAGRLDSPCVDGSRRAQEVIADVNRRESGPAVRAYWDAKERDTTTLPKHLRESPSQT